MTEPELTTAKVVHVEPGDVIWITSTRRVTPEMAKTIQKQAQEFFPDNKIVVADVALDVAVVRPG